MTRSNFGEVDVALAKNLKRTKFTKWKSDKNNCRIKSKPHTHLHTMEKRCAKLHKDKYEIV